MARRKASNSEFTLFDVLYEDGTRRSNRKVPSALLIGLDGDEAARDALEAQDLEITRLSGRPIAKIKSIVRSAGR